MKAGMFVLKGMAVAVLAASLCACGGNDDENSNGGSGAASIVGNWNLVSGTEDGVTVTAQQMGSTMVLHVNANGTYSAVNTDETGTDVENGTWSVSGSTVSFSAEEAPQNAPFTVSATALTITYLEDGESVTLTFARL